MNGQQSIIYFKKTRRSKCETQKVSQGHRNANEPDLTGK